MTGDAGIGKSRLLQSTREAAASEGVTVATGWCLPLTELLPLLPVADIFRQLLAVEGGSVANAVLELQPAHVRGDVHLVTGATTGSFARDHEGSVMAGASMWRQRVFRSLQQVLSAMHAAAPLALVVEDLHWADPMTLDLIEFLLSPAHTAGPALVLTSRGGHDLTGLSLQFWRGLTRRAEVQSIYLSALTVSETQGLLEVIDPERASLVEAESVHRRTGGNPFFTEQLASWDRDQARSAVGASELPPGLTALLEARIHDIGGDARDVLDVLAIAAQRLDEDRLAVVSRCDVNLVDSALASLIERGVVCREADGGYAPVHDLLAEVVASQIGPHRRRELHRRIAVELATESAALAAVTAAHFAEAGDVDDELAQRVRAGRWAESLSAVVEARAHWQRALELVRAPRSGNLPGGLNKVDVWVAAIQATVDSGDLERAVDLADAAYAQVLGGSDGEDRAILLARIGSAWSNRSVDAGLPLVRQAFALYRTLPPSSSYVRVALRLEGSLRNAGELSEAETVVREALTRVSSDGARLDTLKLRVHDAWYRGASGDGPGAVKSAQATLAELRSSDPLSVRVQLTVIASDVMLKCNGMADLPTICKPVLAATAELSLQMTPLVAAIRSNLVEGLLALGRTDEAEAEVAAVADEPPTLANVFDHVARAVLLLRHGDMEAARQRWDIVDRVGLGSLDMRIDDAVHRCEHDVWASSTAAVVDRVHRLSADAATNDESRRVGPLLLLALRALADRAERVPSSVSDMRIRASALLADRDSLKFDPLGPHALGRPGEADRELWNAEWSRLQNAPDSAPWRAAADQYENVGLTHEAAYARFRQAEALLSRPGHSARATDPLRIAHHLAVGHVPLQDAIADLARQARIQVVPPTSQPGTQTSEPAPFDLTERERDVLLLLRDGRSNAEIGRELFISPRTVGVHVSSILRKMDVRTRAHAASLAERAGIFGRTPDSPSRNNRSV